MTSAHLSWAARTTLAGLGIWAYGQANGGAARQHGAMAPGSLAPAHSLSPRAALARAPECVPPLHSIPHLIARVPGRRVRSHCALHPALGTAFAVVLERFRPPTPTLATLRPTRNRPRAWAAINAASSVGQCKVFLDSRFRMRTCRAVLYNASACTAPLKIEE